jgi:hypothetical protein
MVLLGPDPGAGSMIGGMKASIFMTSSASLVLLLCAACGDKPAEGNDDEAGTGETATDSTDGDDIAESGTSTSSTTNDEAESSTESSSDDDSCPIGAEGCPCTDGGGCDPGLSCEGGTCETPTSTDDVDTDDTTDETTDETDTDTDTTETTDTGGDPLYQACPGGEDAECAPDEICVTGSNNGNDWSMCTSGGCRGDDDCAVDDNDVCADLPGDGEPIDYCVPQTCGFQDECPDDMACVQGFGGGAPSVCVWPG